MTEALQRKRIAILGGGVGAMTTAFELTEQPGWQDRYEITVYQLGWRLGGKGASGRNRAHNDRIEEHGLHLWFGYYENAFNMIQRCYGALGRKPGQPLATWRDAFKPHSLFILCQFHDAKWSEWRVAPPPIGDEVPGDGRVPPFWEVVDRLLAFLHGHVETHAPPEVRAALAAPADHPGWLASLADKLGLGSDARQGSAVGLHAARALVQSAAAAPDAGEAHSALERGVAAAEHFLGAVRTAATSVIGGDIDDAVEDFPIVHRMVSLLELGFYMFKGIIADNVAERGFDQLDHLDLREWLASHGAGPLALNSDALRVAYESIFAYEHGSYAKPNLAAGAGLRGLLRLCFTYKGGFAWKMQAGMGDTIFAPLYEVLRARGVRFEFFRRVIDLVPSSDGSRIGSVVIGRQATPISGSYDPLYPVKDLPCWPSEPFYDQLKEGAALKAGKVNLESYWADWTDVGQDVLHDGTDFDEIVLGISIGALPVVASKLVDQRAEWRMMIENVHAIQTQAFQIWTIPDAARLGWKGKPDAPAHREERPVFGGFAQPHNTIADMSHLIDRENWPVENPPGAIYYFCGPLIEGYAVPPPTDHNFPQLEDFAVNVRAAQWLRTNSQFLLPGSVSTGYPAGFTDTFDFSVLYADTPAALPDSLRFNAQFWRANIDPSERYVLTTKGSTRYRLHPGQSGYANLTLAGDWTYSGLNYGCVESAVMSGMAASRAICGAPEIIFGENFPKA